MPYYPLLINLTFNLLQDLSLKIANSSTTRSTLLNIFQSLCHIQWVQYPRIVNILTQSTWTSSSASEHLKALQEHPLLLNYFFVYRKKRKRKKWKSISIDHMWTLRVLSHYLHFYLRGISMASQKYHMAINVSGI